MAVAVRENTALILADEQKQTADEAIAVSDKWPVYFDDVP